MLLRPNTLKCAQLKRQSGSACRSQCDGCTWPLEVGKPWLGCNGACLACKQALESSLPCDPARCTNLVKQTHRDRKACPAHMRGAKGTIKGIDVRYCQKVRAAPALLTTSSAVVLCFSYFYYIPAPCYSAPLVCAQCQKFLAEHMEFDRNIKCVPAINFSLDNLRWNAAERRCVCLPSAVCLAPYALVI